MEIQDITIYKGRNIYSHKTVMKMIIDIGEYGDTPTKEIPGFNEKLLSTFPGLRTNTCGLGYEGGFMEKLQNGTYLGHVLEHVILDMQNTLGYNVKYGKTRTITAPSLYYLVYEYENEVCGLECSKAAVFILNCFLQGEEIQVDEYLDYLKKVSVEAELGPSTTAIVEEAKRRNIPVTRIGSGSLVQLGYGKCLTMVESTLTDATSCISTDIASNKQLTKAILNDHKIPVPYGKVVYSEISAVMAANQIGMPVVLKPFDGNQGKGVHLNLNSESQIRHAFRDASKYSNGIIVEAYVTGNDYRILVVGGKVRAVAERLPAAVTGDGKHTIRELVDLINLDERRGVHHEKALTKIRLDAVAEEILEKQGMNIESIPAEGMLVKLRENGNLSTGGTAIDCTDRIHPDNEEIAVRAADAIGIDIAGIDIVAEDISKSIYESSGAVVEVNVAPGIRMHLFPSEGKPRNVAKDIVDMLYPDDESSYFPIVSVTGTNGKTTTVRLISHVLAQTGKKVGYTSTSGTYINDKCICKGDNSGPRSAKTILSNRSIEAAVLETARGGIVREGLGYDLADVGMITNIAEDHLGDDEVTTTKDLAFVKSLVAEAVKPDGYAVLNADDEMTAEISERIKTKLILFAKGKESFQKYEPREFVRVYAENGIIMIQDHDEQTEVVKINDIPITSGGKILCNVENSLAAVSALYALRIPVTSVSFGLKSFQQNAGRFNIFEVGNFQIMLDYAHNKPGFETALKACKNFDHGRLVGVVGMPGDRSNEAIDSVGGVFAESFQKIYIKEDHDLRGRAKGEVAELLHRTILRSGYSDDDIVTAEDELAALNEAIMSAQEGDLIVVFYEKLEPLTQLLEQKKAELISV